MWRLVLALVVAASCGGSDSVTATTAGAEVGTYALITVDGRPLPSTIAEGTAQVEVIAGTLTLDRGSTFRMTTTFRPVGGATTTNDLSGTYRIQGGTLTFSYSNGGQNTATLSGDTLLMTNEGVVWLFRRS